MNRVLAHTGAKYPIVQAPMGWIARPPISKAIQVRAAFRNNTST
jgi:enoyl-[acyl-carrier protein] reductase II